MRRPNDPGPLSGATPPRKSTLAPEDLNRLEFHRHAVALMPGGLDKRPGVALRVDAAAGRSGQRFCSCRISKSKTCPHLQELPRVVNALKQELRCQDLNDHFKENLWFQLADVLADEYAQTPATVRLQTVPHGVEIYGSDGDRLLTYFSTGLDRSRFLERCTLPPEGMMVPTRGAVLQRLALLTLTRDESLLQERGLQTRRQAREQNFWYKFAYHAYREWGAAAVTFFPSIEENTGAFSISLKNSDAHPLVSMDIPRKRVKAVLKALAPGLANQHGLRLHPIPLDTLFNVKLMRNLDLEIRPLVRLIQKNGEARFFERKDLHRFQYGDLIYIKELGILAEDQYPKPPPEKFKEPIKVVVQKSQVPSFLAEFQTELQTGPFVVEEPVRQLKILTDFDRVEIAPESIERDWYWLSVTYGMGNQAIALAEILRAKQSGQRYVATDAGWVDCQSPAFDPAQGLLARADLQTPSDKSDHVRLSRAEIFRLLASGFDTLAFRGDETRVDSLKNLLALKASTPLPEIKGMTSKLRTYQTRGTEWLWFLHENNFGGLLCDDMGLGKTHQVMAFMACLQTNANAAKPFLVVCPTTVISHWEAKISQHAPALKTAVYHGDQRDLTTALEKGTVLLTSYGILRRDISKLAATPFEIVVFDEIQHLKNPETQAYAAARAIQTAMRIGLTGTPIENSLTELKALLDLTVPGYLGPDDAFLERYANAVEERLHGARRRELSRLIAPFTLRRLKKTVLRELPAKIEDLRSCRLSEDQVRLYRDAVAGRGAGLLQRIEAGDEPIPYIHVFALLNLLKQICNHPALVEKAPDDYTRYQSGKWDLFVELLAESLDSGQKVVVYSQYVGMIDIIVKYLQTQQVGFVSLTGASRNRGALVDRFNQAEDCRVFVGSLKAGGVGIDLVAASVVIHYDRWWNAAKEDQATDRVHRIGQQRGVQVFKLLTEGTLEEKIAAIIEKKRNLLDSVVQEDDPGLLKTFTREDLVAMLSMPGPPEQSGKALPKTF